MKRLLTPGIALGLIVVVWQFVYGALGLYKESSTAWTFTVVAILIQIGVLVWGLMQTAKDGKRYWGQVVAGLLICLIGGIVIVLGSFVFTTVAFPGYFDDVAAMTADSYRDSGMTEEQVENLLESTSFTRTPLVAALGGFIGTMVTGFIVSLIVAAFVRKKD